MTNDKSSQAMTGPSLSISLSSGTTALPVVHSGSTQASVVTASPTFESVKHLLSGKPYFRPRKLSK